MAVRSDYQGYGIGSQLMQAAIDVADNWLNLLRLELLVYTDNDAAIWRIWGQEFEDGRDWRIGERARAPPWCGDPYATSFDIYQHDVYEADEHVHHSIRISKPALK